MSVTLPAPPRAVPARRVLKWSGIAAAVAVAAGLAYSFMPRPGVKPAGGGHAANPPESAGPDRPPTGVVTLDGAAQRAIGLKTARVDVGESFEVLSAPGRVAPDESHYAFITPRAAGVVRAVAAHIGQQMRAGDLLALIDSPEVAQARLDLANRAQELEVARTKADWEEAVYQTTTELVDRLKAHDTPEQLQKRFEGRPVGLNRERLLTAYAQYRLSKINFERYGSLQRTESVAQKLFEQARAEYETAQATYQSLIDRMGFEARLSNSLAQQDRKRAETSVRVAQERLRVLGVRADGTEPRVEAGRVVGVEKAASTAMPDPDKMRVEAILPTTPGDGLPPESTRADDRRPISTYALWAPFDGIVLDRANIVPGVAVDVTQRLFTMADLATVWVEVNVRESDFGLLARSHDAQVRFTSPAYPDKTFSGRVIYSGDLVDEKSRAVLLLARAENPERLLKPGMFLDVEILAPAGAPTPLVPMTAIQTDGEQRFTFLRTGPERFERRDIAIRAMPPGRRWSEYRANVVSGLKPGDEVVVEGSFKLKALQNAAREAGGAG